MEPTGAQANGRGTLFAPIIPAYPACIGSERLWAPTWATGVKIATS
jgi:hypothetical protein